jgi:transposase
MVRRLRAAGVAGVAIERGDGPVVEELLAAGLAVFVVPSRQIKGLRTRYGSAGNKDDRFDAYVLADTRAPVEAAASRYRADAGAAGAMPVP